MNSEYDIGKDIQKLHDELQRLQLLIEQVYAILDFNMRAGKLEEPKEKKAK